jgi:(E)-4-hydroxy-3-methylbut-2-enyl-diphosphate synthase
MEQGRRSTRQVGVGNVRIGGDARIAVQSMTNTDTRDVDATLAQIDELVGVGCEIVRVGVKDENSVAAFGKIAARSQIPVVADIHYSADLAIAAIDAGAHKVRINPGNIGAEAQVKRIVDAARATGVSIRIGVNSGSLAEAYREIDAPLSDRLVGSARHFVDLFESWDFYDIVLSLKATSVTETIAANRAVSRLVDYPLHLGITEAGSRFAGTIKSSVGIGVLLEQGIGDTIRVSLTADPVQEVRVAFEILRALGLRRRGVEIISCPTCTRCEIDLMTIAREVEDRLAAVAEPLTVAVMGCVVNGPGEAREADIGLAGGRGQGLLFVEGQPVGKVAERDMVDGLMREVEKLLARRRRNETHR